MKAKTQELLSLLLWTCDMLSRPTFRNLTDSFETWAYRNGLDWQLARLAQGKLLERRGDKRSDRVYRLTELGRLQSLGGRDPEACWRRIWDGRWRLVLFDFPRIKNAARNKLREYLKSRGFGYLQNSVWLTPHPVTLEKEALAGGGIDVKALIWLEARPCAGESDEEIVVGAWDFPFINKRYQNHLEVLAERPRERLTSDAAAKAFHRWIRRERAAWIDAVQPDPLLPERLLPPDYLGKRAWRARLEMFKDAASQIREFEH